MTQVRTLVSFRGMVWMTLIALAIAIPLIVFVGLGEASHGAACNDLPSHDRLMKHLIAARNTDNGGFNLGMWATAVNRDGVVCAVAFTGEDRGDQ